MITSVFSNGIWTWGSKAGVTFLTSQIEEFVKDHPQYANFADWNIKSGYTPIFEWCSRKNRIVIDHPKDRLVLIAVRNNKTGEYVSYSDMKFIADLNKIDIVKQYEGTVANMQQLYETVKNMSGIEGFVIRFADGHMVKMKCDEYCIYHKAKDDFIREKNIISMIVNNQVDDFLPLLQKEDREKLQEFIKIFWFNINQTIVDIIELLYDIQEKKMTRKDFALSPIGENNLRHFVFKFFDEPIENIAVKIIEEVCKRISQSCGSASKVDAVRVLWGNLHWTDFFNPQDSYLLTPEG